MRKVHLTKSIRIVSYEDFFEQRNEAVILLRIYLFIVRLAQLLQNPCRARLERDGLINWLLRWSDIPHEGLEEWHEG